MIETSKISGIVVECSGCQRFHSVKAVYLKKDGVTVLLIGEFCNCGIFPRNERKCQSLYEKLDIYNFEREIGEAQWLLIAYGGKYLDRSVWMN